MIRKIIKRFMQKELNTKKTPQSDNKTITVLSQDLRYVAETLGYNIDWK